MSEDLVVKYKNTYGYRNNRYPDHQEGIWEVRGEDPNCDFGGSHHQPYLGTFSGKYIDVVNMAVNLGGFWTWGAGGEIKLVTIKKVDSVSNAERLRLKQELQDLELRAAEIKEKLKR